MRAKGGTAATPGTPPPSSRAKDYTERPSEVTDELDQLRDRGLAKRLNKHFTDTTKKLAIEKRAADAALRDLERRRAATSEYKPSGGTLNPFDSLYLELQQKRAECRRKEKETLLLYQRYVDKFGATGKVSAPIIATLTADNDDEDDTINDVFDPSTPRSKGTVEESPSSAPPLPTPSPAPAEEKRGINFSNFYRRQMQQAQREPSPTGERSTESPRTNTTNNNDQEAALYRAKQSSEESSDKRPDPPTVEKAAVAVAPPSVDPPAMNRSSKESENTKPSSDKANPNRIGRSLSTLSETDPVMDPEPKKTEKSSEKAISIDDKPVDIPVGVLGEEAEGTKLDDEDSEDNSIISGLTSINSTLTRQLMEDVETQMQQFLKTETKEVRQILDEREERSLSDSQSLLGNQSVRAAQEAETMAKKMQQMLRDFNKDNASVATGSVIPDEESTRSEYPRQLKTSNPNERWMVHFDETYQREYYHEEISNRTQWEKPNKKNMSSDRSILSHADVIPEAQDDGSMRSRVSTRKARYLKKRRRRQRRRFAAFFLLFIVLTFIILYIPARQGVYTQLAKVDQLKPIMDSIDLTEVDKFTANAVVRISQPFQYLKDEYEIRFTDRLEREEAERQRQAEEKKRKEAERKAREEAERKAKELAAKKAREEAERVRKQKEREEAERKARELKAKQEAERKAREEAERKAREEAERKATEEAERIRKQKEQEEMERKAREEKEAETKRLEEEERAQAQKRRHWGCRVPLAGVVNKRCRKPRKNKTTN